MKLISSIILMFSLSADAFVIQTTNPSPSTTSLKDVDLQWGFDETGCRAEYYLEHWSERNKDGPQSRWAYDPWSGISQTIFIPSHKQVIQEMQQGYSYAPGSPRMNVQVPPPPQQQQAAPLPPSEPAQPMPEAQVAAPQEAAQQMV